MSVSRNPGLSIFPQEIQVGELKIHPMTICRLRVRRDLRVSRPTANLCETGCVEFSHVVFSRHRVTSISKHQP